MGDGDVVSKPTKLVDRCLLCVYLGYNEFS
jgi:hypothetical protein